MYTDDYGAGAASSLRKTIKRVRFFQNHKQWPVEAINPLRRELEREIETLYELRTYPYRRAIRSWSRREAAIRARYEIPSKSN
jgi:hypothetical protein